MAEQTQEESRDNDNKVTKLTFWDSWRASHKLDKVNFIIGIFTLVFSAPVIIGTIYKEFELPSIVLLFVIQNLLVLFIFVFLYVHERRYRVEIERKQLEDRKHFGFLFERLSSKFHAVSHEARDILNRVNTDPRDVPRTEVAKVFSRYCDDIKEIFESIFAREHITFHVTIKGKIF